MKSKFVTALLSIVIAFGLWAFVITNVEVEETRTLHNVPVVFQNEGALTDRRLMLTGGMEQTVSLTVTGKRAEILKLQPNNVSVVVDLSRIYDAGRQSVQYTVNYPVDVVSSDFNYTADKSRISLTVENRIKVEVPVVIDWGEGDVERGYITDTDTVELDTDVITVEGPESVLEQMAQAVIQVDLDGRDETISEDCEYTLCNADGEPVVVPDVNQVVADRELVHVRLLIQPTKVLPIRLNLIDGGGATAETTKLTYMTPQGDVLENIMVAGSAETLETLTELLLGQENLKEILVDTTKVYPVELPPGVTNLSGVDEIYVQIEFPDLVTETFTINVINPTNVPAGMIAEVVTRQINVTVRGPKALVEQMQATDITVSVSFGDIDIGERKTVAPTITISASYTGVEVLSNGNVVISLEEPVPEPTDDPAAQSETDPTETGE